MYTTSVYTLIGLFANIEKQVPDPEMIQKVDADGLILLLPLINAGLPRECKYALAHVKDT